MRKVVNATPNEGMGYLGLALAYGRGMYDEQIATYSQKVGEEWTVVTRRGKQERVKIPVYDNPEKWRRFRQNWSKLRSLEPDNPYVSSWQAYDIHYFMVTGKINEATFVYDSNKLKSLGQKALAEEGYRLARKAYEDGFKFFSPVVALGDIIYFAWQVGGRAEAQQWGELFKPWVAQNPQSPYVEQVRTYYGADCPLIRELTRP
ncbi:MAG: hypothetical protein NZM28_05265 [Fimbriimonadales bacterium]|nr:hypothetical protein [Fimbriimonadales bacterium]